MFQNRQQDIGGLLEVVAPEAVCHRINGVHHAGTIDRAEAGTVEPQTEWNIVMNNGHNDLRSRNNHLGIR